MLPFRRASSWTLRDAVEALLRIGQKASAGRPQLQRSSEPGSPHPRWRAPRPAPGRAGPDGRHRREARCVLGDAPAGPIEQRPAQPFLRLRQKGAQRRGRLGVLGEQKLVAIARRGPAFHRLRAPFDRHDVDRARRRRSGNAPRGRSGPSHRPVSVPGQLPRGFRSARGWRATRCRRDRRGAGSRRGTARTFDQRPSAPMTASTVRVSRVPLAVAKVTLADSGPSVTSSTLASHHQADRRLASARRRAGCAAGRPGAPPNRVRRNAGA